MDLNTMRQVLRVKIGNPNTSDTPDATLTRILNAAYREIGSKYPFNETRCIKSFDTTANVPRYTMPLDLAALLRVWDDTNKRKLVKRGVRYMASLPTGVQPGKPRDYVRTRDWMQLIPVPDAVYTIFIYYLTEIADLVGDTDEPVLPLPWHDGIINKARYIYYDEIGDIAKASYALGVWKDWVADKPSEIDIEKDDIEDVGVIIASLGGEYGRRMRIDPRYNELFDYETL